MSKKNKDEFQKVELMPEEEPGGTATSEQTAAAQEPAVVDEVPEDSLEDVDLTAAAAELAAAFAALEKENKALKQGNSEFEVTKKEAEQQILRLSADFDNFRRRNVAEKAQWRQQIIGDMMVDLLPILDNFQLALQAMQKDETVKNHAIGVDMIYRQLLSSLQAKGLMQIQTVGQPFDPQWQEAVAKEAVTDETQNNIVLEEIQPGYRLEERLIRPAMVKVAICEG